VRCSIFLPIRLDRVAYVQTVLRSVKPGGHVIVATFGADGPLQCSGLPVMRYSADELHDQFGAAFQLLITARKNIAHLGAVQQFVYCYCRRINS